MHVARLEKAEQLGLHIHPNLADLVEEQGAAGGAADDAWKGVVRAGEGTASVAEQLTPSSISRGTAVQLKGRKTFFARGEQL